MGIAAGQRALQGRQWLNKLDVQDSAS